MRSATERPERRSGASRARSLVTVLGTALVVVIEFLLLHAVNQWGSATGDQRVVVARLSGELAASAPGAAQVRQATAAGIARLDDLGLSASELRPLRAAAALTGAAELRELRTAAARLNSSLADRQDSIDTRSDLIYIALLVGASFGWMVWFRKLVGRHRALEHAVTEQQAAALGEHRLAALVRNATDVVLVCDLDGTITFATPSTRTVLGRAPEELVGRRCTELVEAADVETVVRLLADVASGEDDLVRVRIGHADGRVLDVEGSITNLIADPAVNGFVITVRDMTARTELEAQLTHQAFHDSLTGLANRQLFSDRLQHALERRSIEPDPLVVLFCDLDEFKNINDSLGHGVGDRALIEVARRTSTIVRSGDTIARLGGDEFAILLEDCGLDDAVQVAEKLLEALRAPVVIDEHSLVVRASIGLAAGVAGGANGDELLRNADVAMYLAKSRGKGTIAVYDSQLHTEALARLELRADLQRAIRSDEIVVHYQPTIDLADGEIAGFEALVRWAHPLRGLVSPLDFVPIAEQTGLIHALGARVLRMACAAAVEFNRARPRPVTMAVNVTAQQLARTDFVDEVIGVLTETGLAAQRLTLEITESVLLQDVASIVEKLHLLRSFGIRIAIDDFGTGYSSLSYLRDLPLDILKVDKAFVDRVDTDTTDAALTEAIVSMSRSMNLVTVAEGVENEGQAAWLTGAACTYGQGFLWSKPVPKAQAQALLAGPRPAARRTFAAPAVRTDDGVPVSTRG